MADRALSFAQSYREPDAGASSDDTRSAMRRAFELEGQLGGFLAAELSADDEITVETGRTFDTSTAMARSRSEADIVVTRGTERIVLELKRSQSRNFQHATDAALGQVMRLMQVPTVTGAVIVIYSRSGISYSARPAAAPPYERIRIIGPTLD